MDVCDEQTFAGTLDGLGQSTINQLPAHILRIKPMFLEVFIKYGHWSLSKQKNLSIVIYIAHLLPRQFFVKSKMIYT